LAALAGLLLAAIDMPACRLPACVSIYLLLLLLQVSNHAAIVRFALRGAGRPGPRPVSAPLADPTALAAEQHTPAMDAALRHVVQALLVGVAEKQVTEHELQVAPGGQLDGEAVAASAAYLRDRIGVPRDMRLPAARQLRAHLNWLIDSLHGAPEAAVAAAATTVVAASGGA
jgi:hypothetical protein